jgi:hypothetical protein
MSIKRKRNEKGKGGRGKECEGKEGEEKIKWKEKRKGRR